MTASPTAPTAAPGTPPTSSPHRVPTATYRLQLRRELPFDAVRALLPYLQALGVSDLYLSPIYVARPGSTHGYDVLDHERVNPELGTDADLRRLMDDAAAAGMGVIFDVVPNHMCILGDGNAWWNEVLEEGPTAPAAARFDIDWHPPKSELTAKVLLPFLADQYGRVLESGLAVSFADGGFSVAWDAGRLPLGPESWHHLVAPAVELLRAASSAEDPAVLELESILHAITHALPALREGGMEQAVARRHEEQAIRQRLADLAFRNGAAAAALGRAVTRINGVKGMPGSFDGLERLMNDQYYRLAHWRVAAHEINYRRFFDINELAAVRVEHPDVFAAVHALPLSWAGHAAFAGLRVDHVDGLADPKQYLDDLAAAWRQKKGLSPDDPARPYVLVEKILAPGEALRADFAADGTTGYDFIPWLARTLIRGEGVFRMRTVAARFGGTSAPFDELAAETKRLMLETSLAAELTVLARRLDRVSEQHRYTRDFTYPQLHAALGETVASFSVYRTYVRETDQEVAEADAQAITRAVARARRANPLLNSSLFDFVEAVLLHRDPPALGPGEVQARRELVTRFQQLTSAVFAKGVEDTSFYRYLPQVALNEVGSDPGLSEVPLADFHAAMAVRRTTTPDTLSASATHDTKRGEDTRARLYVLSEVADTWAAATARWAAMNADKKTVVDGALAPDGVEEYLLYQTLVGVWPMRGLDSEPDFRERIVRYMTKARHEAKQHTSYVNPNPDYDGAADGFVNAVLNAAGNRAFLDDVQALVDMVARGGVCNSLAQLVLKLAAPGVPDFFQGAEGWDFSLVDPDNRRLVDFGPRAARLRALFAEVESRGAGAVGEWFAHPADGAIKTWVTAAGLRLRRAWKTLFQIGAYEPLACEGRAARHVVAFARRQGAQAVLALAGRHLTTLGTFPPTGEVWHETAVRLPEGLGAHRLRDALTGRELIVESETLPLAEVFATLPVALLETRP